jgi:hypothetical protein
MMHGPIFQATGLYSYAPEIRKEMAKQKAQDQGVQGSRNAVTPVA